MLPFQILSFWPIVIVLGVFGGLVLGSRWMLGPHAHTRLVWSAVPVVGVVLVAGVWQRGLVLLVGDRAQSVATRVVEYPQLAQGVCRHRGAYLSDIRPMRDGAFGDSLRYFVRCSDKSSAFVPSFREEPVAAESPRPQPCAACSSRSASPKGNR